MIGNERAQNVYDVARKIDEHREQCAELNDGDCGRGLFSLQCCIGAAIEIEYACCENEMCC